MARGEVYRLLDEPAGLVVDVQADLFSDLSSRVVVPLIPETAYGPIRFERLTPLFEMEGEAFVLVATDIAAVPRSELGECVGNVVATHGHAITAALDFLFLGF